jgi:hypothetical protein
MPSIEGAWAGRGSGPDGGDQCWALALGHAPSGLGHVVSFVRMARAAGRDQVTLPPDARSGFWVAKEYPLLPVTG